MTQNPYRRRTQSETPSQESSNTLMTAEHRWIPPRAFGRQRALRSPAKCSAESTSGMQIQSLRRVRRFSNVTRGHWTVGWKEKSLRSTTRGASNAQSTVASGRTAQSSPSSWRSTRTGRNDATAATRMTTGKRSRHHVRSPSTHEVRKHPTDPPRSNDYDYADLSRGLDAGLPIRQ